MGWIPNLDWFRARPGWGVSVCQSENCRMMAFAMLTLLCATSLSAAQADVLHPRADGTTWNQFRGPNGSGVARACRPPVRLDGSHVAWKTPVPPGLSSPVLAGDRIFLMRGKAW